MFEQVGFWNGVKSEGAIKPKDDEERSASEKKGEKGRVGVGVGVGELSCIKSNEIEDTHIWQSWQLPSFHHYLHWLSNFHTFLTLLSLSLPSLCLCPCPAVPVPVLSILWIRRRYTHLIRFPPSWTIVFRKNIIFVWMLILIMHYYCTSIMHTYYFCGFQCLRIQIIWSKSTKHNYLAFNIFG